MSYENRIKDLIEDDLFTLCSGKWDVKKNKFIKNNSTDKGKCCLETCVSNIEECGKICSSIDMSDVEKYKSCIEVCEVQLKNVCEDNCRLIDTTNRGFNNPIYIGTTDSRCGDGYFKKIDKDCLKKNKDNIIKVCNNNCNTTQDMDCQVHCNYSYDKLENPELDILYRKYPDRKKVDKVDKEPIDIFKILGYSFVTLLSFILLFFIMKKILNK
jgi:hypothetical protein